MTGQEIAEEQDFVTVVTAGQVFGLNLDRVRDVFVPRGLSPVPLAPPEVAGLLNLRRADRHARSTFAAGSGLGRAMARRRRSPWKSRPRSSTMA